MSSIRNIKYIIVWLVFTFTQISFATQSLDSAWANNKFYRIDSWKLCSSTNQHLFTLHQKLAYSVVCTHELCEDPSSNTAAFGFSVHKKDGTVLKSIEIPLLFSSGKLAPGLPSFLNVSTIDELFSKSFDISSPRERLVRYVKFVSETLGLQFDQLDKVCTKLSDKSCTDKSPGIPTLRLESGELDVPLGYIRHCEQCFFFELIDNPDLLQRVLKALLSEVAGASYISLNILTYNDMCQRCFAGCTKFLTILQTQTKVASVIPISHVFISSFRPFEIKISDTQSAGFTRGTKKCNTYEEYSQLPSCNSDIIIPHGDNLNIFQFYNPWMLEAQRDIDLKKHIRSAIQALSDNVPFIYEDIPENLQTRKSKKQLSLSGAVDSIKALEQVKGDVSDVRKKEIERVKALINEAYETLLQPLSDQIQKLNILVENVV